MLRRTPTRLVVQLCEAAAALHAHGIIHRDISPTNVIVAADGAHLIDLGIARFRAEGATHDTTQLGTPGFAAPEQHGFAQTDARTDVYSLGRVLGYLLTGVRPEMPDAAEYEQALADEKYRVAADESNRGASECLRAQRALPERGGACPRAGGGRWRTRQHQRPALPQRLCREQRTMRSLMSRDLP